MAFLLAIRWCMWFCERPSLFQHLNGFCPPVSPQAYSNVRDKWLYASLGHVAVDNWMKATFSCNTLANPKILTSKRVGATVTHRLYDTRSFNGTSLNSDKGDRIALNTELLYLSQGFQPVRVCCGVCPADFAIPPRHVNHSETPISDCWRVIINLSQLLIMYWCEGQHEPHRWGVLIEVLIWVIGWMPESSLSLILSVEIKS